MWIFYTTAFILFVIGFVIFLVNKKIIWQEWLISGGVALALAGIMQAVSFKSATSDSKTVSGQLVSAIYHPEWVEKYKVQHSRTTGSGKTRHTTYYYTTHYRTHPRYWVTHSNIDRETSINQTFYNEIVKDFGGNIDAKRGNKSGFHSGDPNIYVTYNKTGYIYPVTKWVEWVNRIKAAKTVFSYVDVPNNAPVFDYPYNVDWMHSDRLLGNAKNALSILEWDKMNTRVYNKKAANVILIGFGKSSSSLAQLQEAKYIGGKENDVVICYGADSTNIPIWSKVFSWTENDLLKKNIETILLNQQVNNDIIPFIEQEIMKGFVLKDFRKFDYISVSPPTWCYWTFFIVMMITQIGLWIFFHMNEFDREETSRKCRRYY